MFASYIARRLLEGSFGNIAELVEDPVKGSTADAGARLGATASFLADTNALAGAAVAYRNALIRELYNSGSTQVEIAEIAGLKQAAVSKVLKSTKS